MANEAARQLHDEVLSGMKAGMHDAANCPFCTSPPAETAASEGAGMAGEATTSTIDLKDPAVEAIVNDRVARETADLRTRAETAERERDEALTRIDVLDAEKTTAEQARAAAEGELTNYRQQVENERAAGTRRDSRKAALVEQVPHLNDDWFGQEVAKEESGRAVTRLDRIASMSDEAFEDYKSEIASAFTGVEVKPSAGGTSGGTSTQGPPRETAMHGTAPSGSGERASRQWIGSVSGYGGRR